MSQIRIGIIFGGKSGEHEVSIVSAFNVSRALDPSKYQVTMIGIDKTGRWCLPSKAEIDANIAAPRKFDLTKVKTSFNILNESKSFDVIFPVMHGTYGEDGTIQGMLEMLHIPYVGSGVLGSSAGMDKEVAKRLFDSVGVPVVPFLSIRKHEFSKNSSEIIQKISQKFSYPLFVKPANMGSSVGVHKVKSAAELPAKLQDAFLYDTKVLVEKGISARELEVSILGNHELMASVIGEIIPTHEFYSYEAKYLDENGAHLKIPAEGLTPNQESQIKEYAKKAFQVLECRGLGRVDFFVDKNDGQIYLNEINTIPGFTQISMYPKMLGASGVSYSELLNRLVQLALEHHQERTELKTSF